MDKNWVVFQISSLDRQRVVMNKVYSLSHENWKKEGNKINGETWGPQKVLSAKYLVCT